MYRNPNLRTYERKRPGTHSTSSVGNTIIREDVPPDKNILSKELPDPTGENDNTMDDPFDTTFDRLLKTAKLPPKPPSDVVDSSYAGSSSSSDEERAKDDSPIPLPPVFDEPAVKKRRFAKREKADKKVLAVMSGGFKRVTSRTGRLAKARIVSDENTEPNIEQSAVTGGTKRGKNRAAGSREENAKRQRIAKKRTSITSYRGRKRASLDDSTSLSRSSVNLTTLEQPDSSAAAENLPIDPSGSGKSEVSENAATPGPSKMHESNEHRFVTEEATSVEEFVERPASSVDAISTTNVPKPAGLLKNPTVSLTRLSVPKRFSVANNSWTNSTPIDRRTAMKKALLRLSPIDANGSMRRVRHGDENSGQASLPPKSPVLEPVAVESTIPKNAQPSSEIDADERSEKRRAFLLSESPAPEPSCLLFEDSEAPDERSLTDAPSVGAEQSEKRRAIVLSESPDERSLTDASSVDAEQSEKRRAIVLSESPAPEPSCLLFEDSETADERSQNEENFQNLTDASTTTPFKGFSVESSDPESLQLRYEASNRTASSEDIAPSVEKDTAEFSLVGEEIDGETMETSTTSEPKEFTKDSSDGESLNFTLNDDDDEDEDEDEKSSKDPRFSSENALVSHPAVTSEKTADIVDASTNEQLGGFPESSKNSTVESSTNNSEKFDSDDDWTTVTGSSYAEADASGGKSILVKSRLETSETRRRGSIEQLSSDEDDSLSDDISELVNANDASASHMLAATESGVATNLEDGRSAMFEDINGNESKVQETSVVGKAREKEIREDIHLYLRQPVVLLERLILPDGILTSTGSAKNKRPLNPSDSIDLRQNSTLSSIDDSVSDIERPIPAKKSKRPSKGGKMIATRFSDNIETSQNTTSSSVDDGLSDIETPVPARKSRKLSKVEETIDASFSDTIKSGRKSTLSSADDTISDIEEPLPAKKSRGVMIAKKVSIESSQNSTLDSADDTVSDIEEQLPPRKSRFLAITKRAASIDRSEPIESSQNSTLDSADDTVSDIEEQLPPRKSRLLTITKRAASKDRSEPIESSQNSTLDSADDTVSDIEEQLPPRKSRLLTITKKASEGSKGRSDSTESRQNLTFDSSDRTVSDIEEPHPGKKSRRLSKVEETMATNFSDTIKSGQNSTLTLANDSVSFTETSVPARKSKRLSKVETDVEERLPTRKSRGLTITKKSGSKEKSRRFSRVETDIEEPLPARKSRGLTITKKSGSKEKSRRADSLKLSGNPTPSENSRDKKSLEGDEEAEVDGKVRKSSNGSMTELRKIGAYNDARLGSVKPVVLLTRLNDPVRVSLRRRNKYSNMNLHLSAIAENTGARAAHTIEEAHEENAISESYRSTQNIRPPSIKLNGEDINSQQTTASFDSSFTLNAINESRFDDRQDRPLFLKPGKFWARSLSILSNVHSQEDLEALAVGKGKKWRESAANILQLQQQGLLQSCVKKNEDDKESRSFYGVRNSAAAWSAESSQSNASRVFGAASPERFVRRVSIRVVPDGKSLDRIQDSPFLEAYGITSSRNRQTISERSTSIGPRKTLVYNVQDVRYDNISRGINSTTSRDVVLRQCCQETSLPFDECYPLSYLKHCRKIGEGVYGEVFLYEKGDEKNVIKIIPIEGEMNVNNERQKKFDEILSEIVIAKELHNLRYADSSSTSSFVEVKNIRCVVGKYPRKLVDLWKTYDDEKNSENDCPVMFDKNQLYIVLELGHGGQDLEAFVFQNASESHALFMQAAVALAVAEEKLDFEHRDLHWGNILISRTEDSHVEYKLRDKAIRLASKGVKVSVIDFTLSRMSYQGCSIYNDLSMDEDLFSAQGDYQFEIYRLMRKKVENDWQRFEPFTNVLWLHYTLDKMTTTVRYRRKNSKIHNTSIEKLRELKDKILDYKSAFDFVTNCDKATRLQGSRTSVTTVG